MLRVLFISLFFWIIPNLAHAAEARYASIVIDADTQEVLHARQIDETRFPASLTKIMTLYLAFDALNAGTLTLSEPVKISSKAANAVPSKLGLRAGRTITTENLIKAIAVKSANDAAVVMAERLAGSEAEFARRMTEKAKSLGMSKTHFMTASGLPHPSQTTSARDLAKLATKILTHHRRYYHYFGLKHFTYKGRVYKNTNSLLHWLKGVDGFKTGYTNASGYNLMTSAERDGRRLIAVVFGGATGKSRDRHMKDLIERGFEIMGVTPITSLPLVEITRKPKVLKKTPRLAANNKHNSNKKTKVIHKVIKLRGRDGKAVTIKAAHKTENGTGFQSANLYKKHSWAIQIGAFKTKIAAEEKLAEAGKVNNSGTPKIRRIKKNGQTFFRARYENLDHKQAKKSCKTLAELAIDCLVITL